MLTSLDILHYVIVFAVLWVAAFICWFLYQVVIIIKEAHRTLHSLTAAIDNVERAIDGVKNKFGTGKLHDHIKSSVEELKQRAQDFKTKK